MLARASVYPRSNSMSVIFLLFSTFLVLSAHNQIVLAQEKLADQENDSENIPSSSLQQPATKVDEKARDEDDASSENKDDKRFIAGLIDPSQDKRFIKGLEGKRFMKGFADKRSLVDHDEGLDSLDSDSSSANFLNGEKRFINGLTSRSSYDSWSQSTNNKRFINGLVGKSKKFMKGFHKRPSDQGLGELEKLGENGFATFPEMVDGNEREPSQLGDLSYATKGASQMNSNLDTHKRFMKGLVRRNNGIANNWAQGFEPTELGLGLGDEKRFIKGFVNGKRHDLLSPPLSKKFMKGFTKKDNVLLLRQAMDKSFQDSAEKRFMKGFTKRSAGMEDNKSPMESPRNKRSVPDDDDVSTEPEADDFSNPESDIDLPYEGPEKKFMRGNFLKRDEWLDSPVDEANVGLSGYSFADGNFGFGLDDDFPSESEVGKRFMRGFTADKKFMRGFANEGKRFLMGLTPPNKKFMRGFAAPDKKFIMGLAPTNKRFLRGFTNEDKRFMRGLTDKRFMHGFVPGEKKFMRGFGDSEKRFLKGFANTDKRFMLGFTNPDKKFMRGFDAPGKRFMRGFATRASEPEKRFIKGLEGGMQKRFIMGLTKHSMDTPYMPYRFRYWDHNADEQDDQGR